MAEQQKRPSDAPGSATGTGSTPPVAADSAPLFPELPADPTATMEMPHLVAALAAETARRLQKLPSQRTPVEREALPAEPPAPSEQPTPVRPPTPAASEGPAEGPATAPTTVEDPAESPATEGPAEGQPPAPAGPEEPASVRPATPTTPEGAARTRPPAPAADRPAPRLPSPRRPAPSKRPTPSSDNPTTSDIPVAYGDSDVTTELPVVTEDAAAETVAGSAEPTPPRGRWRRLAHRYGWLGAVGLITIVVLVCWATLIAGAAPIWNSAAASPSVTTPTSHSPSASRSVPRAAAVPAQRAPVPSAAATSSPAERPSPTRSTRSAAAKPVLLGPNNDGELHGMLHDYCRATYGGHAHAWSRQWRGSAGDWVCRAWGQPDRAIDMSAVCAHRYGAGAYANLDGATWRCYRS